MFLPYSRKANKRKQRKYYTDWDKVDAMTDQEIEQNALDDPDAQPISDEI